MQKIAILAAVTLVFSTGAAFAGAVTVPEPASMTLLATGAAALAIFRMRRRK